MRGRDQAFRGPVLAPEDDEAEAFVDTGPWCLREGMPRENRGEG